MAEGSCREPLLLWGVLPFYAIFESVTKLTMSHYRFHFPLPMSIHFHWRRILRRRPGRETRRVRLESPQIPDVLSRRDPRREALQSICIRMNFSVHNVRSHVALSMFPHPSQRGIAASREQNKTADFETYCLPILVISLLCFLVRSPLVIGHQTPNVLASSEPLSELERRGDGFFTCVGQSASEFFL